jgi:hypothetical protein
MKSIVFWAVKLSPRLSQAIFMKGEEAEHVWQYIVVSSPI